MGKIIQNIKAKTILVIAMLATILMQIIAPILPVNAETLKDDYIEFSAVWANGTNQNNIDSGKAGTINFGLKLSGISTGFQNLKIYASEESSGITPSAEINFNKTDYADNSNGRILIFESTMNSGLDISGNLSVVFNKNIDLTEYDKTIKLTLTGEYKDPVTKSVQTINKTIKLNAHIKPVEVNGFYVQTNYNDKVTSEKKDLDNFWKTEWVTTKFGTDIVLTVNANNFTYLEYNLETEKHSSVAMKNNLEIDTTELENAGFNVTKTGNIITLKYGKKDNIYNENEIYSINKKFNIPVRYTVPEDTINNAKWDGGVLEFTYRIIGTAQGYSITKSKLGTTTNEVETYEYTGIRNTVRVDLGNFEYLYGLYTHNNILDKSREELQEDINSGNIILNSEIRIDAKDYRLESDRSNIFFKIANGTTQNMGVQVKYYDENGNIQTQRIEDSI